MARCFISFLGVNDYVRCNYLLNEARVDGVRFVQSALLKLVAADFTAEDSVLIGCTAKARATNLESLIDELADAGWAGPKPAVVDLPEATSERELWEIFQILMDRVRIGDELIFDITHSFRSLPMLFTVLIQYLGVVKKIRLRGVYYGAFERLGSVRAVQEMTIDARDAPIVDLTPFLGVYAWGTAIDHFLRFGQVGELQTLISDHINPVLKATRGRDDNARALRGIVSKLADFATNVQYVRGKALSKMAFQTHIVEPLRQVRGDFLPPLQPVLDTLTERFRDWPDRDPFNGLRAVEWCIEHGLIQQGLTLLQETLVEVMTTRLDEQLATVGADKENDEDRLIKRRIFISKLLNVLARDIPPSEWRDELAGQRAAAQACARRVPTDLPVLYEKLTQLRNDINHAGYVKACGADKLRQGLEDCHRALLGLIEEIGAGNESRGRTYFVSRHPGARGWAAGEGLAIDAFVDHINIDRIRPNDSVIGTLPVNLAAEICARGGHYLHLSLDLQAQMRGQELTAEQMRQCGARLEPYLIQRAAQHDGD